MTSNPIVTFYRRLLELTPNQDPAPQLEEALTLLVRITAAAAGYVELAGERETPFSLCVGLAASDVGSVRTAISGGAIAHALSAGRTIELSSTARALPTALAQRSVAIACAPIGEEPIGVVYLERPQQSFRPSDVKHAKLLADRSEPLCAVLLPRTLDERIAAHKRAVIRQELQRNGWNKTTTARLLGVGRAVLYRAMQRK